jgi:uncharacterized protein (PEP-CTERM system associated)
MRGPPWCSLRAILMTGAALALFPAGGAWAQSATGAGASSSASGAAGAGGAAAASSDLSGPSVDTAGPPALQAPIGTLLPPLGADPSDISLHSNLLNGFGQSSPPVPTSAAAGPSLQFKPQLTISEEYANNPGSIGEFSNTANLQQGRQGTGAYFVTMIQPQIAITDNTERVQVNLFYAPTGEIYAENSNYDQFRQQFNGGILGTVLPGLIYADLRGSVFQAPVFGSLGTINTNVLPPAQRETISNVSFSPYLVQSFGGTGTLQAGVGYVYSATDAPAYLNQVQNNSIGIPNDYGSSWLADRRLFASFTTGEDYGRFKDSLSNDTNFYDGSGVLRNGQRIVVTNDVSYAVNRFVSALGEIGYENLHYPNEGFSYVGGVWSAGARVTPNAVSTVTAEYRYIDGFYSPYVYGSWQVTPRIRILGGYSEGITSFGQDQQNSLLSGSGDATGAAASGLTAAPLLSNGGFFGSNQGLNHNRRLTATATYTLDRDAFTLTLFQDRETAVGNPDQISTSELQALGITPFDVAYVLHYGAPALIGLPPGPLLTAYQDLLNFNKTVSFSSNNLNAGMSWHHDLTPTISSDIYGGYTRTRAAETTLSVADGAQFSASLSKTFSARLSGRLTYAGNYILSGGNGLYTQSSQTVTISLTRQF